MPLDLTEILGAKATHRFARLSATKARVVLDLIRDEDIDRAQEVLQFCDRGSAHEVGKVLASAVANAEHNESLLAEDLYVADAFADEGPTLKRWRPRARGRATRINKQTCHITVVVARLDDDELAERAERGDTRSADRRRRVEASRSRAASDEVASESEEAELSDETGDEPISDAEDSTEVESSAGAENWAGGVEPPEDGSIPEGFEIKGNANSMKYHEPGGTYYDQTVAEVYFESAEAAEAAGFAAAGAKSQDADDDTADQEGE